jgi:hypothetical protein
MARIKTDTDYQGNSAAFAVGNEPTLAVHHSPGAAQAKAHLHGDNSIARAGKPKRFHDVGIHNGMKPQQVASAGLGGMGHGVAVIDGGQSIPSKAAAPLANAYGGMLPKVRGVAPVKSGMKNQCGPIAKSLTDATPHDIRGKMLMDEGS